ncbi:hypothetical protein [Dendronalium sp. ChiSLP03b]|uniref:hypothetical protein n=1 Tax=Dendronalium sp. ChiSLP03b TaxID=3075381 RepID=UPI002ADA74F0|nr:hypothetical protein [Dendronalium sp. ChiSLP03b]
MSIRNSAGKLERVEVQIKEPTILASHGTSPEQYPNWDEEDEEWEQRDFVMSDKKRAIAKSHISVI